MPEKVGVIGAGSWGTTLAKVLGDNRVDVLLWARHEELAQQINDAHENPRYLPEFKLPGSVRATTDLEQVCATRQLLLLVVPSHGLREIARQMGEFVHGEHVVVHAVKGIEQGTFRRMSEVLREETCLRKIGVLSGPNLARELAAGQPAGTLIASAFDEVYARCADAFGNGYFRVYGSRDVAGAEIGGAFKNIVALAAGVAAGMSFGDNTKALLLTRGLVEMARFGQAMGADWVTFGGMAGIGDLMATCASPLSRNHQVGRRLAAGESLEQIQAAMHMVAEGVKTTKAVHDYAVTHGIELPIVRGVYRLLYEGVALKQGLRELLATPTGREFGGLRP